MTALSKGLCFWAVAVAAGMPAFAQDLRIGGSGGPTLALEAVAKAFHERNPQLRPVLVSTLGTRGGIRAVAEGVLEVGVASRELSAQEMASGLLQVEFARTPFVFATQAGNKTARISLKEVTDIYAGRMRAWPGGDPIRLVLRPEGDSDTTILRGISEELRRASMDAQARPGMVMAITDAESSESLEKLAGSFGTTTLSQILVEKRAIRALVLDGVAPTVANAQAGRYSLHKRFYLVLRQAPAPQARQFVAFVQSRPARLLLEKTGHWTVPAGRAHQDGRIPRR